MTAKHSSADLRKLLLSEEGIDTQEVARQLKGNLRTLLLEILYGDVKTAEQQLDVYRRLVRELNGHQHKWMESSHFQSVFVKSASRGSEIYWKEILYRAHVAGALAFLRSYNWLSGAIIGCEQENIHVIAASLRGFLESAADINSTFKYVSRTLADNYGSIREAIRGKAKVVFMNRELEDRLIHFTHARRLRRGEEAAESHRAESAQNYFDQMGAELGPLAKAAYEPLCALTHPSALSTACFLDVEQNEIFDTTKISTDHERLNAASLLLNHDEAFRSAVYLSFNHSLIALRVVHAFPLSETKTPYLEKFDFSQIEAWRKCRDALRKQGVHV